VLLPSLDEGQSLAQCALPVARNKRARSAAALPCLGEERSNSIAATEPCAPRGHAQTDEGTAFLANLFRGRSQLLIYHFMFGPEYTAGCPSCSLRALLTRNRQRNVRQDSESAITQSMPGSGRRIVTTHDKAGKAIVFSGQEVPVQPWPGTEASGAVIWSTDGVPADNSEGDLGRDKRGAGMLGQITCRASG
jgi:hypothetical protein